SYVTDDGTVDIDLTTGLDAFEGPVMLVAGSCNTLIGPEHQARYHAPLFRNARLEVIEDAGHSLIGEQPQVVVPLFRTFLNETRPRNSEAEGPPPVTP
ncbi:MAG: alpha/beta fold hydrolase, partial [Myxococcota bacterium]